jgi:excinuclease ABC subunit C
VEEQLRLRVQALPENSGVYIMKDVDKEVLYVGKAKNLKSRVSSYFAGSDTRPHIEYLLEKIHEIETIVTESERQALVLESDLIKKFKPRYNIRLKDDKAPFMVMINQDHEWPRLELVRKKKDDGNLYFGPYPFGYELRTLLEVIERSIPLRTCNDRIFMNRVRPCLQYQIKRCSGPCCIPVSKEDYKAWIQQAISLLKGNTEDVIADFKKMIEFLSEELRFEEAAVVRDRLLVLEKVAEDKSEVRYGFGNFDAIGLYREGLKLEISVLKAIDGRLVSNNSFSIDEGVLNDEEILSEFILTYYNTKSLIPDEILVETELQDNELILDVLRDLLGRSVLISNPQRGVKKRLIDLAYKNAKEGFEARHSSLLKSERLLEALRDTLQLTEIPRTIECIDISHFQGSQTVGAVVCFKDAKPFRSRYRYFHLSQEGKPDDFASIYEVVSRHIARGIEENTLCDLLLIDGGPPQIQEALRARKEVGGSLPCIISIAKKREPLQRKIKNTPFGEARGKKPERIYVENHPMPVILKPGNEVLNLLEQIRDETHRSVITFHRKIRAKKQLSGPLDAIQGLGISRKRRLLSAFGSFKRIKEASIEDLIEKGGLAPSLAKKVFTELNKNSI